MILTFADKEAERLFHGESSKRIPADIQRRALRKLLMIDASANINDLRVPPSNHLEKLQGARSHQHSITINDQWRACFTWRANNAYDVSIEDYH
jgi:proteic killer suppression protein